MVRFAIAAFVFLSLQSCASDVLEAGLTGMCIASEAGCIKSCQRDYRDGRLGRSAYDYCTESCTGGGNGCAFTAQ